MSNTLFSLLLNGLRGTINNAQIHMYADDAVSIFTAPSDSEYEFRLNITLCSIEKTYHINFNLSGKGPTLKLSPGIQR